MSRGVPVATVRVRWWRGKRGTVATAEVGLGGELAFSLALDGAGERWQRAEVLRAAMSSGGGVLSAWGAEVERAIAVAPFYVDRVRTARDLHTVGRPGFPLDASGFWPDDAAAREVFARLLLDGWDADDARAAAGALAVSS